MIPRSIPATLRAPARRAALALMAAALSPGCVSLVPETPPRQWYLLEDLGPRERVAGERIPRVLLVEPVASAAFHDSTALPYGRAPGARAHYQFANWTERPSRRIGQLLERRLLERGRFDAVAQSTAGVRGDLLLRVTLDDLWHDVTAAPGTAVLAMGLELIDWTRHRQIARQVLEVRVPVDRDDAAAAAAGFSLALTTALGQACDWIESRASIVGR